MTTCAMMELPSRLVNRYLREGGDLALVPLGSVEELGPHLPVGGQCFACEAYAKLMAEKMDGLYLPVVPCGPCGTTYDRPGSIHVPNARVTAYVRAVMDDLHTGGFRRIVLVTFLDYARYYLPQEFYEDLDCAAAGVHLGEMLHRFGREDGCGVDDLLLGSMNVLGMTELVARCMAANERLLSEGNGCAIGSEAYESLRPYAAVGYRAPPGQYPHPPKEGLSPDKGEAALRRAIDEMSTGLESLRAYNEYIARRGSRGFERGSWFRNLDDEE